MNAKRNPPRKNRAQINSLNESKACNTTVMHQLKIELAATNSNLLKAISSQYMMGMVDGKLQTYARGECRLISSRT